MKPLVTVIIPFFNRIPDTLNAINSVVAQEYKNIELILVDDASSDDITEIKSLIKNFEFINYLRLDKNNGPARARNVGLNKAQGEYIAFLDSDDLWHPTKISIQIDIMLEKNYLFTHTSYSQFHKNKQRFIEINSGKYNYKYPIPAFSCRIATPTVILKKSIIKEIKFDENMRFMEDTLYWLNLSKQVTLVGINIPLTTVNISKNSSAFQYEKYLDGMKNIRKKGINNFVISYVHLIYTNIRFRILKKQ